MVAPSRPRRGALVLALAAFAAVPAYALAVAGIPALAGLEPGRWQVRDLDADVDRQSLCLGDPMALAQLEHEGSACAHEVVESGPGGGTVRYTCPGLGFGQTILRVETPRVAKIHTQGFRDNRPFSYRAEARRVGGC